MESKSNSVNLEETGELFAHILRVQYRVRVALRARRVCSARGAVDRRNSIELGEKGRVSDMHAVVFFENFRSVAHACLLQLRHDGPCRVPDASRALSRYRTAAVIKL